MLLLIENARRMVIGGLWLDANPVRILLFPSAGGGVVQMQCIGWGQFLLGACLHRWRGSWLHRAGGDGRRMFWVRRRCFADDDHFIEFQSLGTMQGGHSNGFAVRGIAVIRTDQLGFDAACPQFRHHVLREDQIFQLLFVEIRRKVEG